MSAEAWTFLGVAVTALAGIIVVIIQNRRQGKQLTDMPAEGDPTLRAMVATVLTELAQGRIDEAVYHAEQDAKIDALAAGVKEVRAEVTDLRGIVLSYHPEVGT